MIGGPRRSRALRARAAGLVLVGTVGVAGLVVAPPAGAQESLIESDPQVIQARVDLYAAQAAAHEAVAQLESATEQRDEVQSKIDAATQEIAATETQRAELAAQADALGQEVRGRAAALYVANGQGTGLPDIFPANAAAAVRRQHLGEIAERHDRATVRKLTDTREQLAVVVAGLRHTQDELSARKAELDTLLDQLTARKAQVDQKVTEANAALERARVIGALRAARDPIMGPNTLSAAQILGWFNSRGYRPQLDPGVTMASIVDMFLQEAADEGVRGDVAFAQSVVETGGFAAAPYNNFSGLGWCDSCTRGNRFPTPRDGIRAQMQLLVNYADSDSRAARLHHPPSPYWWGADPATAVRNFDTFFAKGWAPTWRDMGHGNWATDPNYSAKVLNVYGQMQAYTPQR